MASVSGSGTPRSTRTCDAVRSRQASTHLRRSANPACKIKSQYYYSGRCMRPRRISSACVRTCVRTSVPASDVPCDHSDKTKVGSRSPTPHRVALQNLMQFSYRCNGVRVQRPSQSPPADWPTGNGRSIQELSRLGKRFGVLAAIDDCRVKVVTRDDLKQHGDKGRMRDPSRRRSILQIVNDLA